MPKSSGFIKTAGILFFLVVVNVLILENWTVLSQPLTLKADFLFHKWETSQFSVGLYILFSFLLGFILAGVVGVIRMVHVKSRQREEAKKRRESETSEEEAGTTTQKV